MLEVVISLIVVAIILIAIFYIVSIWIYKNARHPIWVSYVPVSWARRCA